MEYTESEKESLRQIWNDFRSNLERTYQHFVFGTELCVARLQTLRSELAIDLVEEIDSADFSDGKQIRKTIEATISRSISRSAEEVQGWGQGRVDFEEGLMRTVTVFLHAALECALREVLRISLYKYPERLKRIPYAGGDGRATKLSLDVLASHRDESIEEYIQTSVNEYLNRRSFSSVTDVATDFQGLGIDLDAISDYLPSVERMIKRRHQIVHQFDLVDTAEGRELEPLVRADILSWTLAEYVLVLHIISTLLRASHEELGGGELDMLKEHFGERFREKA